MFGYIFKTVQALSNILLITREGIPKEKMA